MNKASISQIAKEQKEKQILMENFMKWWLSNKKENQKIIKDKRFKWEYLIPFYWMGRLSWEMGKDKKIWFNKKENQTK